MKLQHPERGQSQHAGRRCKPSVRYKQVCSIMKGLQRERCLYTSYLSLIFSHTYLVYQLHTELVGVLDRYTPLCLNFGLLHVLTYITCQFFFYRSAHFRSRRFLNTKSRSHTVAVASAVVDNLAIAVHVTPAARATQLRRTEPVPITCTSIIITLNSLIVRS